MLKYYGPKIKHIYGVDNIVANTLSVTPSTKDNIYEPGNSRDRSHVNKLFATSATRE